MQLFEVCFTFRLTLIKLFYFFLCVFRMYLRTNAMTIALQKWMFYVRQQLMIKFNFFSEKDVYKQV